MVDQTANGYFLPNVGGAGKHSLELKSIKKNQTNAAIVNMHLAKKLIWGSTWEETHNGKRNGYFLPNVVDAANHCLRAHTCLKLPFSFMSPSPLPPPPPHSRKYKILPLHFGRRWISKWNTDHFCSARIILTHAINRSKQAWKTNTEWKYCSK